jgi:hypothetical protein
MAEQPRDEEDSRLLLATQSRAKPVAWAKRAVCGLVAGTCMLAVAREGAVAPEPMAAQQMVQETQATSPNSTLEAANSTVAPAAAVNACPAINETKFAGDITGHMSANQLTKMHCYVFNDINLDRRYCSPVALTRLDHLVLNSVNITTALALDEEHATLKYEMFSANGESSVAFEVGVMYNVDSGNWNIIDFVTPQPCLIVAPGADWVEQKDVDSPQMLKAFKYIVAKLDATMTACGQEKAASFKLKRAATQDTEAELFFLQLYYGEIEVSATVAYHETVVDGVSTDTWAVMEISPANVCNITVGTSLSELGWQNPSMADTSFSELSQTSATPDDWSKNPALYEQDENDAILDENAEKAANLKESVSSDAADEALDWRIKSPNCVAPVADLYGCGASYAVAMAGSLGDRFCIAANDPANAASADKLTRTDWYPQLAAQQYLSCPHRGIYACQGANTYDVYKFAEDLGLVNETCNPYIGGQTYCRSTCVNTNQTFTKYFAKEKSLRYVIGEADMMADIALNGPLYISHNLFPNIYDYVGGVYWKVKTMQPSNYGCNVEAPSASGFANKIVGWGVMDQAWDKYGNPTVFGPNGDPSTLGGEGDGSDAVSLKQDLTSAANPSDYFGVRLKASFETIAQADSQGMPVWTIYCNKVDGTQKTWYAATPICTNDMCYENCPSAAEYGANATCGYRPEGGATGGEEFTYTPGNRPVTYGGVTANVKYWIVQAPWGTTFGESGFYKYRRGQNDEFIEKTGMSFTPKNSISYQVNSQCKCNGHGELTVAGVCHCKPTWGGQKCEVDCKNLPFLNAIFALKCNDEGEITECALTGTVGGVSTQLQLFDGHCAPVCSAGNTELVTDIATKEPVCLALCPSTSPNRNPRTNECQWAAGAAASLLESTSSLAVSMAKTAAVSLGEPSVAQCAALKEAHLEASGVATSR